MPDQPSPLTQIVLSLLTPLMLTAGITDTALARSAAQEAIAAYPPGRTLLVTQIVAFAMAALDNLRLSTAPGLALSMTLKLRGNANALNRASLDATATRDACHQAPQPAAAEEWGDPPEFPTPEFPAAAPSAAGCPTTECPAVECPAAECPVQEPVPTTLPVEEQNRRHWANAMATVAAELKDAERMGAKRTGKPAQTPAQRKSDKLWIEVLTSVAADLRQPFSTPNHNGLGKADLLRTTLMAGGGGFPAHLIAKPAHRRGNR